MTEDPGPTPRIGRWSPLRGWPQDVFVLASLLVLATALRLPNLATRGTWDGDQGHDMLVLRQLVRYGVVPLLGPPTSIGDVHHGAWYYFLLSPAAALTGGDQPIAVVLEISLAGIAAVGVTWWLGRSIGGRAVGAIAGLLLATSAAAIDESTFIWNPNLIALSSAVALAAAWRAWSGHDGRWWVVAAIGTAVTMQCHILGIALLPIIGVPFLLDARRRPLGWIATVIAVVFVIAYLPLAIHELTSGFGELHAAARYLRAGDGAGNLALPIRLLIVGLRVVSWPLTGLIVDGLVPATIVTMAVIAVAVWAARQGEANERRAASWLGLGVAWTIAFLTVAAPSLAAVVRGLPNDHYHAFADPMVVALASLGVLALMRTVRQPAAPRVVGVIVALLLSWNIIHLPPAVNADGGYPAAQIAAARVDKAIRSAGIADGAPVLLVSAPSFKSTEALAYPLALLGRVVIAQTPTGFIGTGPGVRRDPSDADSIVVLCDQLFREANGADCGGPAETAVASDGSYLLGASPGPLLDRFEAAPGRWMSVYGPRSHYVRFTTATSP